MVIWPWTKKRKYKQNQAYIEYKHSLTFRVCAVVWECGEGQTDRHTDGRDQYTFRVGYASREM